ncbi:MAG: mechanosensitive ion channel family protein [Burkholderiales bacterium]|nr:mechanosensitive ion channel family protein [Burkholderiales bacterium]
MDWTIAWMDWGPELRLALRITAILAGARLVHLLAGRMVKRLRLLAAARASGPENAKWIETVGRAARYALSVVALLVAGMLVLNEVGVSIAPILGAAGVVSLAIGFGAQSLIKDYFTGLFLLVENQIRVGDVVEIAGKSGLVEEVSLRKVMLRDYDGSVHYVSNGLITTVTNRSTAFSFALIDVGIAYRSNIDQAMDVMRRVAGELRAEAAFADRIIQDIEIAGVESLAESAIILRSRIRTLPLAQRDVRRAFLKRIKEAFEAEGIEIPFPNRTLHLAPSSLQALRPGGADSRDKPAERPSRFGALWRGERATSRAE